MTRDFALVRQTRKGMARLIAVLAILLQVVLFTEHAGAAVITLTDAPVYDARLGFLDLCTGGGDSDPAGHEDGAGCAICINAAASGFDLPDAPACPAVAAALVFDRWISPQHTSATYGSTPRCDQIRAPPLMPRA